MIQKSEDIELLVEELRALARSNAPVVINASSGTLVDAADALSRMDTALKAVLAEHPARPTTKIDPSTGQTVVRTYCGGDHGLVRSYPCRMVSLIEDALGRDDNG